MCYLGATLGFSLQKLCQAPPSEGLGAAGVDGGEAIAYLLQAQLHVQTRVLAARAHRRCDRTACNGTMRGASCNYAKNETTAHSQY